MRHLFVTFVWLTMAAGATWAQEVSERRGPDPKWLVEGARRAAEAARELPGERPLWKASLLALAASSALDAHSSWGKLEANPLLASGGRFGVRGLVLKAGLTGAAMGLQWRLIKRGKRSARYFTVVNFGWTAFHAGVAAYNYGNQRPPQVADPPAP